MSARAVTAEQIRALPAETRNRLAKLLSPRMNRYIPHRPTVRQSAFLLLHQREALYGGAAGGGKSDALLIAALQYVDVPGYSALILRRTFRQLSMADSLIPRSHEWLAGTDASWNGEARRWTFPSGATLEFGHLEHEADKYSYQGAAFQFVGFDELTQFGETQYLYLLSRLRRLAGASIPIRMRAASNPGGLGHVWVKLRFVEPRNSERPFVPARLEDNPHLDRVEYAKSLAELDPFTRAQLLAGDWSAKAPGSKFRREWFEIVDAAPADAARVRYWDLAATAPKPGTDPDWTAGARVSLTKAGVWYVEDIARMRTTPGGVESAVRQCAELDGRAVTVYVEQEPGASGVNTIDNYVRRVLLGFACRGDRPTGPKDVRANPVSSQAEAGNVKLVRGAWIPAFLDEAESFPGGDHDDMVDAVSGAFGKLAVRGVSPSDLYGPALAQAAAA
jgi:predicted phage terminase large subunit-like protein